MESSWRSCVWHTRILLELLCLVSSAVLPSNISCVVVQQNPVLEQYLVGTDRHTIGGRISSSLDPADSSNMLSALLSSTGLTIGINGYPNRSRAIVLKNLYFWPASSISQLISVTLAKVWEETSWLYQETVGRFSSGGLCSAVVRRRESLSC